MNFSEYCESLRDPLYQVEGKTPMCPPGYRFDKKKMDCVPKTEKDSVSNDSQGRNKDSSPANSPNFNVIGKLPTQGYAYAERDNWDTDAYNGPSGKYYTP